jgi:putative nucleotidyltransferase with HDIG domain
MSTPVRVLQSLGQALAAMRFYAEKHPARDRAINSAFEEILLLLETDPAPRFTFVEGEAVYHRQLLRDLKDWDWALRLEGIGVQRIELGKEITVEDFERFLDDLMARLAGEGDWSSVGRQFAHTAIRYGPVGFREGSTAQPSSDLASKGMSLSLENEIRAVEWIHGEVKEQQELPMLEAEVVVRSLALAIHQESQVVLPLLRLRQFDQYTTTHSCNVAVLATAFAEFLGYEPAHARALGVCGLLHDIGKVWIPRDILVKPGRLTAVERGVIEQHPIEGARILIEREHNLDLAAVVSFEHHRWIDGRGYPARRHERGCHHASLIVQVCDVFDALCTDRPYRAGMDPEVALAEIESEAGSHFDAELVAAFGRMVRGSLVQFTSIDDARQGVVARNGAHSNGDAGESDDTATEDAPQRDVPEAATDTVAESITIPENAIAFRPAEENPEELAATGDGEPADDVEPDLVASKGGDARTHVAPEHEDEPGTEDELQPDAG